MTPGMPLKQRMKRVLPGWAWRRLRRLKARTRIVRAAPTLTEPVRDDGRVLACLVAYNELGGYCVPRRSAHREAAQAIVRGRVWEADTLRLIGARTGTGDIVHAGTYFGDFLPALSAACAPGARVWAFEPGRENHRCAAITLRINGIENVSLLRAGLGAAAAEGSLLTRGADGAALGGGSRVSLAPPAGADEEAIPIVALDAVVPPDRPVSVIHLDVEGHEAEALLGARATLARARPVLVLETVPPPEWLASHLAPLGYARAGMVDDNTVFLADAA